MSGAWFDTGRVDSLFLALTLLAVAWGRQASGVRGGVGLGAMVFLAFFTKQTALVALLPVLAYLVVTRRRVGVAALLTLVALLLASTAVLDALTGGLVPLLRIQRAVGAAVGASGLGRILGR